MIRYDDFNDGERERVYFSNDDYSDESVIDISLVFTEDSAFLLLAPMHGYHNDISLDEHWYTSTLDFVIRCSDGDISYSHNA